MKKPYSKPEILFESFVANVNIAACGYDVNVPTRTTCGVAYAPSKVLFVDGSACNFIITEENEEENSVCYHNPTDLTRMFGS